MPQFLKNLTEAPPPFLGAACLVLLFIAYVTLLLQGEERIPTARAPGRSCAGIVAAFLALYGLYGLGVGFQSGTAWIPVTYVLGAAAFAYAARQGARGGFADLFFILWVWLPIDAGWFQKAWLWPPQGLHNLMAIPFAVCLVFLLARNVRGWREAKFHLTWSKGDGVIILRCLVPFLALAIPFGLATHFIAWSHQPLDLGRLALSLPGVLLLVAVPEELLFRGLIMKGLEKRWRNPRLALWVSAVIFGLSHLNNGDHPDWRYAVLATVAGVFYAKAFTAGRSFSPAVIVHTLVDVIWLNFFR